MINAITEVIPFKSDAEINIIDLGCGTGTMAHALKQKYSKAKFTCVDISDNMLTIAESKLGSEHLYLNYDFYNFEFPRTYDVIISSLALHHLESDEDKQFFYTKIYSALNLNGIFVNGDVVKASTEPLQSVFIKKWIDYMNRRVSMEEINTKWLPNYYAEDRPTSLLNHLNMFEKSGFSMVDVIWKYYGFSVYSGQKT